MHIDFKDQTNTVSKDNIDLLHNLLMFAAKKENISQNIEVSVSVVNNPVIQQLNFEYRDKNEITDVLSFGIQDSSEGKINFEDPNIPVALGDIVISIERAIEQAEEYRHTLERELGFLTVHGFLHLLGYDHLNQEDERIMFHKQDNILKEFGLER